MSRILVIDDEEVIRSLIVEILETVGHTAFFVLVSQFFKLTFRQNMPAMHDCDAVAESLSLAHDVRRK